MPRSVLHIQHHPCGPRVWIFGQRVHHGAVGIVAAAVFSAGGLHLAVAIAAAVAAHDAHDWRRWFAREGRPSGADGVTARHAAR